MKRMLIAIVLLPCLALAEGFTGANGTNKGGEWIYIGADGFGDDPADGIYVFENRKSYSDFKWKERYPLLEECPSFSSSEGEKFSCRKAGKSPLAGATYRVTTSKNYRPCHDESIGTVYACVAGCDNPRVPKIFYKDPWECVP